MDPDTNLSSQSRPHSQLAAPLDTPSRAQSPERRPTSHGDTMIFELLRPAAAAAAPRLGRLSFPGRAPVDTPAFLAGTSRGCVPHLTPDNVLRYTSLGGAFFPLEDFLERKPVSPIHKIPAAAERSSPLHAFTALPAHLPTVLAPRRSPAVVSPAGNSGESISIFTLTGFHPLTPEAYVSCVRALRPDAVVGMADWTGARTLQAKRQLRAAERTEQWTADILRMMENTSEGEKGVDDKAQKAPTKSALFAPVLAVEYPLQWEYLTYLADEAAASIAGLALYDPHLVVEFANHPSLQPLPRLSLDPPTTPHQILHQASLGIDVFSTPLFNQISDAGVALSFAFPVAQGLGDSPSPRPGPRSLGIDMWAPEHKTALTPLVENCPCYTCTRHHRAYLHHLLLAKEMLGWTLLQLHNHHVASSFFAGIRSAIASDTFEEAYRAFALAYEAEMPVGTGARPRARGYHFKSEAGQQKFNKAQWARYGDPQKGEQGDKAVVVRELVEVLEAAAGV